MSKLKKDIFVFVDFDGTIMKEDTSDEIFRSAGGFEENITLLKSKQINIFEYWHRFAESISQRFTQDTLNEYCCTFEIDKYFSSLLELCESHSVPLTIVSDNFDVIVRSILEHNSLTNLKLFVNKLDFHNEIFVPSFPFASEGCEESYAAVCKRNIILNSIPDGALVVYIGDGYSDFGAAEIADVIFAKRELAKYCNENRIPHHQWKTFFDVKFILEKMLKSNRIHSRYQAHLARKRHFENE